MKPLLLAILRIYKNWVSPALPAACRYVPTCSEYAMEAVEEHGALRGSWLAMRRLARCHPFGGHGADPVPPREQYQRCREANNVFLKSEQKWKTLEQVQSGNCPALKGHGFSRAVSTDVVRRPLGSEVETSAAEAIASLPRDGTPEGVPFQRLFGLQRL